MSLKQRINEDFIKAFKAGDKAKKTTLGMLKASITEGEKKKGEELTNDQILTIIQSYDKKLDQTINMLKEAGQGDAELATSTVLEKKFIEEYLPVQWTEKQINDELDLILPGQDPSNKNKLVGNIMGFFKLNYNGQYNPALLKQLIDEKLK